MYVHDRSLCLNSKTSRHRARDTKDDKIGEASMYVSWKSYRRDITRKINPTFIRRRRIVSLCEKISRAARLRCSFSSSFALELLLPSCRRGFCVRTLTEDNYYRRFNDVSTIDPNLTVSPVKKWPGCMCVVKSEDRIEEKNEIGKFHNDDRFSKHRTQPWIEK